MCHRYAPKAALFAFGFATCIAPASRGQVAAAGDVKPPTVVSHVDAVYPPSALAAREHADVSLAVTVDADGHVSKVEVTTSSGQADLDEAAVVAARQWTFTPAMRGDKPIPSRITVPFHFAPPAPPPEVVDTSKPNVLPEQPAVPQAAPTSQPALVPAPTAPTNADGESAEEVDVHG